MSSNKPLHLNSKFILPISMLYLTAMLAADTVAFKFIGIEGIILSGATIVFPFTYLFGDVISEVYGYDMARRVIWLSLIAEVLFALIIKAVVNLPYASFANHHHAFDITVGSMLRFVVGGVIGNIASSFLNVYLISKWKILYQGRMFWLRSVLATAISELVISASAILIGFTAQMSITMALEVVVWAYGLEMIYAFIFVWPAWWLSSLLKKLEQIDAYDYDINYNPFKFS